MDLNQLDIKKFITFDLPGAAVGKCPPLTTLFGGIHIVPSFLTPQECHSIIQTSEAEGFTNIGNRNRLLALETNGALVNRLQQRLEANKTLKSKLDAETGPGARWIPPSLTAMDSEWVRMVGSTLNPCIRITKYKGDQEGQQRFDWHRDAAYTEGPNCHSGYTLMVYLNEAPRSSSSEEEGGETEFLYDTEAYDRSSPYTLYRTIDEEVQHAECDGKHKKGVVRPQQGTAVFFDQRLLHRGVGVTSWTKYILRSDVLFHRKNHTTTHIPQPLSEIQDTTVKLFRKAQLMELDGRRSDGERNDNDAECQRLYDLVLAIRSNWHRMNPETLPGWVLDIVRDFPLRNVPEGMCLDPSPLLELPPLSFLSSDGLHNTYQYPVGESTNNNDVESIIAYVKVAALHAITCSTKTIVDGTASFASMMASFRRCGM
eukprot:PhF_6_TR7038/c0_g1_i2/m.10568